MTTKKLLSNTKLVDNLIETILLLEDKKEAKNFLRDLLTEQEINEFSRRWEAAQLLDRAMPYYAIVKKTGLSSTTIARISKWLNDGCGGYKSALNKTHHTHTKRQGAS